MDNCRKRKRNATLKQRSDCWDCNTMVSSDMDYSRCIYFLDVALEIAEVDGLRMFFLYFMATGLEALYSFYDYQYRRTVPEVLLERKHRNIQGIHTEEAYILFRFKKIDLRYLKVCLKIDPWYQLRNGVVLTGDEIFLLFLGRMSQSHRLIDWEKYFGIKESTLCIGFQLILDEITCRHNELLYNNIAYFAPRFPMYNEAIRNNLMKKFGFIPPNGEKCVGYTDGSRYQISKSGDQIIQRACYNGKDHIHCLEFQSTTAPDGMCMDYYGPVAGSRHDAHINRESNINGRMEDAQRDVLGIDNIMNFFILYKDKAYVNESCGRAAHRGVGATVEDIMDNIMMADNRITVEWTFGDQKAQFKLIGDHKKLNIHQSAVGKIIFVSMLLLNCRTCLYGSNTGRTYGLLPPTLGHYFGMPDLVISNHDRY